MPPPQHQLTSEAAHDLAGALRGLPETLESLNDRIEQASSKAELETKLVQVERQLAERQRGFEEKQAATRRRTIAAIVLGVMVAIGIAIAFVILVPVRSNREQVARTKATVAILQRATGANALKAQQDFTDLFLAKQRCQTQQDLQTEYEAATGRKNLLFNPPACQAVVDTLQNKFNSDLASQASGSPPTTASTRPKSGSGASPGSPGPSTPPGTTPTTQPPTPPTTQPPPPTPPSTVVCVTSPVVDGCVKQPGP